jgi:hypothetical protein
VICEVAAVWRVEMMLEEYIVLAETSFFNRLAVVRGVLPFEDIAPPHSETIVAERVVAAGGEVDTELAQPKNKTAHNRGISPNQFLSMMVLLKIFRTFDQRRFLAEQTSCQ